MAYPILAQGFVCPKCNTPNAKVKDSRGTVEGIRRRRECQECRFRFTTYEITKEEHDRLAEDTVEHIIIGMRQWLHNLLEEKANEEHDDG